MNRIEEIIKENKPFVAYRKSGESLVNTFCQETDEVHYIEDFTEKGFVFAPFDSSNKTIYFPKDNSQFFQFELTETNSLPKESIVFDLDENGKEFHISLVEKGVSTINQGDFEKVVLSRTVEKQISDQPFQIFQKLLHNYKHAFVYIWYHPKVGTWLGATPETLFKVKETKFTTMSLAGTALNDGNSDFSWGEKEIVEQKIVTDFIIQNLKTANLEEEETYLENMQVSKPFTKEAGNVKHICSLIQGEIKEKKHLGKIIETLHPTPAVCGMPKEISKQFILKEENYDRKFYTGFLGELNLNENTDLYVNLRCMEIDNNIAKIYVGGGITDGSVPELEWKETVNKSRTMLKVVL
ncbi:isochorismate synthase [Aureivirga sp. CE67]|uniref:isochorismate synthase n=1 Tax=Aureivirga sp. CE67 TaxID=1788983 RepID=UPI0018CA91BE|nr:isochorismate synthase [Aureivirga sp. CE67]